MAIISLEGADEVSRVMAAEGYPDIAETFLSYVYLVRRVSVSYPYIMCSGEEICRYCFVRQEEDTEDCLHDDHCIWVYSRGLARLPISRHPDSKTIHPCA